MFKIIIFIALISLIFNGCCKCPTPSTDNIVVEQNIWNDKYHEETVVTTYDTKSEVVSTVSTKQQSINMKEMDELTRERIDKEIANREQADIDFLSNTEKVSKVLLEAGKIIGEIVGTVIGVTIRYQK